MASVYGLAVPRGASELATVALASRSVRWTVTAPLADLLCSVYGASWLNRAGRQAN